MKNMVQSVICNW